MRIIVFAIIMIITAMTGDFVASAAADEASPFDLPLVSGEGSMHSGAIFGEHRFVFLVFWESSCPHCVDALLDCERFHREFGGDDTAVIGVNGDGDDVLRVRRILSANGITFPQLWDRHGAVGRLYGIPLDLFTLVLIADGTIALRAEDPPGDVGSVMEEMLAGIPNRGGAGESSGGAGVTGAASGIDREAVIVGRRAGTVTEAGFLFGGTARLRFLSIDSRGEGAVGPYGEEVSSRNDLLLHFELAASRGLGSYLTVGGLLRVSNEGDEVLRSGPQYFDSEWGSAFAEVAAGNFTGRVGYYSIFMTPLTLMRWDWDDNPRTGGDAGCGCGAAAGVLRVESLEELGPDLVFEGATASFNRADFEARAFYAIPRRAVASTATQVAFQLADDPAYSLEVYGGDLRFQRHDRRTGSFWSAALSVLGSWENPRSLDFTRLGFVSPAPHHDSSILSLSARAPLLRWTNLTGEWIAENRMHLRGAGDADGGRTTVKGSGWTAGVLFDHPRRIRLRCDYISLDEGFYSPFAALSYEPNHEGWRVSSRIVLPGGFSALSLFYKNLRAIEVAEGTETMTFVGSSFDLDLESGFGASAGWIDREDWTEENVASPLDVARRALTCALRYRFETNAYVQAQYQRVEGSGYEPRGVGEGTRTVDTLTNLFSLYLLANF